MSIITGPWQALDFAPCELGEGARFVGDRFIAVDLLAGRLLATAGRLDTAGNLGPMKIGNDVTIIHEVGMPLGAVAPVAAGGKVGLDTSRGVVAAYGEGWIAAAGDGIALIGGGRGAAAAEADDGDTDIEPRWLARPGAGPFLMRMNDGIADPFGRFWAGVMPYDGKEGAGFLVRVDPDGNVKKVLTNLSIPNGPAFSADGATMYLADTPTGTIMTYEVDGPSGELGAAQEFAHVDEGGPDGMTVDAEGYLWSAVWGGGCLLRFSPDGSLDERIEIPAAQPTSIALSTTSPYRVLVTSATYGLEYPSSADGRIHIAPVGVAGTPTNPWTPAPTASSVS